MSSGLFLASLETQVAPSLGTPYDWVADTIKIALSTDLVVPDLPVAGGLLIFFADPTAWAGVTFAGAGAPRYALIYSSTAGNRAIYLCDFGASYPVTASPFNITWDVAGIEAIAA